MSGFPYSLTDSIGTRGTLGLIVLRTDETIEQEFRRIFTDPALALYVSRIPSAAELTAESIEQMERDLPAAAALLPQTPAFDAVGYACTSGTTLIGADRVESLVRGQCNTRCVTNPLSAALAAFRHLGARTVGLVSPYAPEIARPVREAFETAGISVPHALSFGEEIEANVARIAPASLCAAALEVAQSPDVDAVFLSCTNLRTLDIIKDLEQQLRRPVIGSNLALAWSLASAANALDLCTGPGTLFRRADPA